MELVLSSTTVIHWPKYPLGKSTPCKIYPGISHRFALWWSMLYPGTIYGIIFIIFLYLTIEFDKKKNFLFELYYDYFIIIIIILLLLLYYLYYYYIFYVIIIFFTLLLYYLRYYYIIITIIHLPINFQN